MKRVLLTGSGGFIGSHLKKYLKEYILFTPRSFELNLLDRVETEKYIEKNNIDYIVHCASCGVRIMPDATLEEVSAPNIQMFKNLLESGIPIITIGSGAEYDKSRSLINIREENFGEFIPKDPYGYSKYLISKEIEKKDNILNLRLFGIYGLGEDPSRVTSCIINDNLNHRPIMLNQNVRFHFIWIDDFCKIVKFFLEHETSEKFINIAPTQSIEIIELANIINELSDYKSEIVFKKTGLNREYTADNSRLLKEYTDLEFTDHHTGMNVLYNQIKSELKLTRTLPK